MYSYNYSNNINNPSDRPRQCNLAHGYIKINSLGEITILDDELLAGLAESNRQDPIKIGSDLNMSCNGNTSCC